MIKTEYKRIKETLYHEILPNGLNVFLLPKEGFHKTYVTFSTSLGSVTTKIAKKDGTIIDLPEGIAHFLEHKLFEQNNGDISMMFSKNQANVNAFTQNNRTTYLFSCTDNLKENIKLLLDFVQKPDFTEKGIEKEKGIIKQEIKMYEDDPSTVSYMGVLNNMFEHHPVKIDILGTVESISKINKEILEITHQTFYSPKQMVLFVTGNFQVDEIFEFVSKQQENITFDENYFLVNEDFEEQNFVVEKYKENQMEITVPNLLIGIKQGGTDHSTENIIKKELEVSILFDLLLGKSSANYKELLTEGLVNDTFGIDITYEDTYGYFLIGSETYLPKELEIKIRAIIQNLPNFELKIEDFNRAKKQIIGGFIHALNSLEFIANQFTKYYYTNVSLFEILEVADLITIEDIEHTKSVFENDDSISTFVIYPK
ncbi:MAG: insulinase family protein [Bacilli bacterium]|nr:insulinase family protein [Bacilli bacterium]